MENQFNTETAIEQLVTAFSGANATAREKHICREALRSLVRLAKSEQMLELKMDVDKLTSPNNAIALSFIEHSSVTLSQDCNYRNSIKVTEN